MAVSVVSWLFFNADELVGWIEIYEEEPMKPFTTAASVLFALVAATHACRIFEQWDITIAGIAIPMWASYLGLLISGGLSPMLWLEARHKTHG